MTPDDPAPRPPTGPAVLAAIAPGWSGRGHERERAVDALEALLRQDVSLETFLRSMGRLPGLDRVTAARLARACAALPLPGGGLGRSSGARRAGGRLRVGLWTAPEGLDAGLATTRTSRLLTEQLYSTLTALDADGRPYPDLAEWIEVSDNDLAYTFGIRRGVRFHDGTELTAEDVAASLDRICDPDIHYHFAPWTVTMAGTEVVDRYTVRLRLTQPTGPILTWLAFCGSGILPAASLRAGHDHDVEPIGSGPFRLAEGGRGGRVLLSRHEAGGGLAAPWLDEIEFIPIPDDAERARAVLDGRIDLDALAGPAALALTSGRSDLITTETADGRWHWIAFDCRTPLFADSRVRRAVGLAINRKAMLGKAYGGHGTTITGGPIPAWGWAAANDLPGAFPASGDPAAARALLAAAGAERGAPVVISVPRSQPVLESLARIIADGLQAAGLSPRLEVHDERLKAGVVEGGGFNLTLFNFGSPINDPDDSMHMVYRSGDRFDYGKCLDPQLDRLLDAARASTDQAVRRGLYRGAQTRALEMATSLPTIQPTVLRTMTARLQGFVPMRNAQLKTLRDAWLEPER